MSVGEYFNKSKRILLPNSPNIESIALIIINLNTRTSILEFFADLASNILEQKKENLKLQC